MLRGMSFQQLLMWETYYGLTPADFKKKEGKNEPWQAMKMAARMHAALANAQNDRDAKGFLKRRRR